MKLETSSTLALALDGIDNDTSSSRLIQIQIKRDWEYDPINVSLAMNNLIAYNYIHDIGGDLLRLF